MAEQVSDATWCVAIWPARDGLITNMTTKTKGTVETIATGGTVEMTTSRPSLAGNPIKGAEQKFQPAGLKDAEFFRPCAPRGRCPWTGLSRTALIAAAEECGALVRLRQKHKVRGSLLVHRDTLTRHLIGLATAGKGVE